MTQAELAEVTGISLSSLKRLELGEIDNPPLRWLVNIGHAFGLADVNELFEDEWWEWKELKPGVRRPPDPRKLWNLDRWRGSLQYLYDDASWERLEEQLKKK